jgi:serine protease Do
MIYSRFYSLNSFLVNTATITAIVIIPQVSTVAKTSEEIFQIAKSVTVQINGLDVHGGIENGTGFIIARNNDIYTVLTANHVLKDFKTKYTIRTYNGKQYAVTDVNIKRLQKDENDADIAILTFKSSDVYDLATLGNSDQTTVGKQIFVYGYPSSSREQKFGVERDDVFSPGLVISRLQNANAGYTLRYNAVTKGGMSGGPVFDSEGRVIGIHGRGDREYENVFDPLDTKRETIIGQVDIKTGFNAAIPINTFLDRRSQIGEVANIKVDNTPVVNSSISSSNNIDDYIRGLSSFDRGDMRGAIANFSRAIDDNSNNYQAYFYRGLAQLIQGDITNAIADYSQAININPSYTNAYYNRGVVLSLMGKLEESISDYSQVINRSPNFYDAYNNRGLVRLKVGDQQGAIDDFNQALRINPRQSYIYYNRGVALFRIKDYQGAIANYTRAIYLDPNYAKAYGNRGVILVKLGDKRGAIADLQQAAQLFRVQGLRKDYQKAMEMIQQLQQ